MTLILALIESRDFAALFLVHTVMGLLALAVRPVPRRPRS
jgi:hypothetical protein